MTASPEARAELGPQGVADLIARGSVFGPPTSNMEDEVRTQAEHHKGQGDGPGFTVRTDLRNHEGHPDDHQQ